MPMSLHADGTHMQCLWCRLPRAFGIAPRLVAVSLVGRAGLVLALAATAACLCCALPPTALGFILSGSRRARLRRLEREREREKKDRNKRARRKRRERGKIETERDRETHKERGRERKGEAGEKQERQGETNRQKNRGQERFKQQKTWFEKPCEGAN